VALVVLFFFLPNKGLLSNMTTSSAAKSADAKPQTTSTSRLTYYQTKSFRSASSPAVKVSVSFSKPSRTRQEFKDECDINNILRQYGVTGVLTHVNRATPLYEDVTSYDYQEAMDLVANARSNFDALPSHIRTRFDNDPSKLLDFVQNPLNRAEAHSLGLLRPDYQPPSTDAPAAVLERSSPMQGDAPKPPVPNPSPSNP